MTRLAAPSAVDPPAVGSPTAGTADCAHCGLPVWGRTYSAEGRSFCCAGCLAVYQIIGQAGLQQYYQHREKPSGKPVEQVARPSLSYSQEILRQFEVDGAYHFILDGLHCAACVWLIEHVMGRLPGLAKVEINYALSRMRLRFVSDDPGCPNPPRPLPAGKWEPPLAEVLDQIAQLGYSAIPYDPRTQERPRLQRSRQVLLRMAVAACAAANIMLLAFALYAGAQSEAVFRNAFHWLSLVLCLPVILYSAQPYWNGAYQALRQRTLTSDIPICLGLAVTFLYSVYATVAQLEHVYFDTAATFVFVLLVGRTLEGSARARAGSVVERLMALTPQVARKWVDGRAQEVEADQLQVGDVVEVLPGQKVPRDGVIREGQSFIDTSALTGESLPQALKVGDRILGGSLSLDGRLLVEVQKSGEGSLLAQVRRFLELAETSPSKTQRQVDRVARLFLAATLASSLLCLLGWCWVHSPQAVYYATTVLIITCPCALGIATPLVVATACGLGASRGILFRGGPALETIPRLTHLLLDKTGTLTTGKMEVVQLTPDGPVSADELMRWAASAEASCTHPIAKALLRAYPGELLPLVSLRQEPGQGVVAELIEQETRHQVWVGSPAFIGATPPGIAAGKGPIGSTCVAVARNGQTLGHIYLADPVRQEAQAIVAQLKQSYHLAIASGDQADCVAHVAQQLGISDFRGGCSPLEKAAWVQQWQSEMAVVGVVGDGINDAPALQAADLGLVVDQATDLSTEAADVVLLRPGLAPLLEALDIGKRAISRLRLNFALAAAYNLIAIPSAALGYVSPLWAAVAMPLSSLAVTANSISLYWNSPSSDVAA